MSTTTTTAKSLKTSIEGEVFFNLNLNRNMGGNTKRYHHLQTVTEKGSTFQVMLYQQGLSELLFKDKQVYFSYPTFHFARVLT